jgi:signal transduction histidine kinase
MQPDSLPLLLTAAGFAAALAWWMRTRFRQCRARAYQAEKLALSHGRSLCLAAQELRGIVGSIGIGLGRGAPSGGEGPADGTAEEAVRKILRLADNLAELAAPTSRVIREAPARLGPVVDAAIATVGAEIRPGHRYWLVDPALRALTVQVDERALVGALGALLRRAASLSRNGDIIGLRWVVASETVSIVVEDEGDGLAAADLAPEAGPGPAATRGLDLGLSLARSLAVAHGGDVRLESAPGIGARAWLTLPRARVLEHA